MAAKISTPASAFEKALRSFETGGFTYNDFRGELKLLLAAGASANELLNILHRRELIEPLPDYAHDEVMGILTGKDPATLRPAASPDERKQAEASPEPVNNRTRTPEPATPRPPPRAASSEVAPPPSSPRPLPKAIAPWHKDGIFGVFSRPKPPPVDPPPVRPEALDLFSSPPTVPVAPLASAPIASSAPAPTPRPAAPTTPTTTAAAPAPAAPLAPTVPAAAPVSAAPPAPPAAPVPPAALAAPAPAPAPAKPPTAATPAPPMSTAPSTPPLGSTPPSSPPVAGAQVSPTPTPPSAVVPHPVDVLLGPPISPPPRPKATTASPPRRSTAARPRSSVSPIGIADGGVLTGRERVLEAIAELRRTRRVAPQRPGPKLRAFGLGAAVVTALGMLAWLLFHRAPPGPVTAEAIPHPVPAAGTQIHDCAMCPVMTVLPVGRFKQGVARTEASASSVEQPQHWVIIGHPIAISTNPVTVEEFRQFVGATGRAVQGCEVFDGDWKVRPKNGWKDPGFVQTGAHPVTCVSWEDAQAYAQWVSAQSGQHYRLPSASEWEYAARAGGEAAQPWTGNASGACIYSNVADTRAARQYPRWPAFACDDGFAHTAPVGSFKANAFGLGDTLGNVLQWTGDCWFATYAHAPTDGTARTDGNCADREVRGAAWSSAPADVRLSYRSHLPSATRDSRVGIRLVRDLG